MGKFGKHRLASAFTLQVDRIARGQHWLLNGAHYE
jgi:hypothetical protein